MSSRSWLTPCSQGALPRATAGCPVLGPEPRVRRRALDPHPGCPAAAGRRNRARCAPPAGGPPREPMGSPLAGRPSGLLAAHSRLLLAARNASSYCLAHGDAWMAGRAAGLGSASTTALGWSFFGRFTHRRAGRPPGSRQSGVRTRARARWVGLLSRERGDSRCRAAPSARQALPRDAPGPAAGPGARPFLGVGRCPRPRPLAVRHVRHAEGSGRPDRGAGPPGRRAGRDRRDGYPGAGPVFSGH